MSMAADRRARVGAAVDRAWGEGFLLTPRCRPEGDPDGRPVPDTARPAFPFVGRFLARAEDQHARSRSISLQETKAFNTAASTVTAVKANLPAPIGELDLLTRADTGEVFTVTRARDGDFGRVVLILRNGPR